MSGALKLAMSCKWVEEVEERRRYPAGEYIETRANTRDRVIT